MAALMQQEENVKAQVGTGNISAQITYLATATPPPADWTTYLPAGESLDDNWLWTPDDGDNQAPSGSFAIPGGWLSVPDNGD